ncbi:MAG: Ni/Fe hydrogenase subunit alpha [Chloroflexaceae bacterium]|nr:Ni/Fe hydrogenase subunit alpha [Chloroflexaceae bacterium]
MTQQLVINPVTRIEGHAKITLHLDDDGLVQDARFHVTQVRGFEKFCTGRPFYEMPSLMARICGICPVSHLITSAKACDMLLAVYIPETAVKLRRILNLAQLLQSHALNFFYLSSPDLLLGMDSDPAQRNIFGIIQANPQLARDGIKLRQIGQQIIQVLAGKRIHPAWVVPGGVSEPLDEERRDQLCAMLPDALAIVQRTLVWFKGILADFSKEIQTFANFPTLFMGLVNQHNTLEHYAGWLRVVDAMGNIIAYQLDPAHYQDYLAEAVEPWSFLKSPYYQSLGYPDGMYRVGPLARVNIAQRCGTPRADEELDEFRALHRWVALSSFYYHYARLIEMLYAVEQIELLLDADDILSPRCVPLRNRTTAKGIGIAEAPRGMLLHHYRIDQQGLVTWANLIIASGHNNLAMNRGILQVARHFVKGAQLTEGMLNRVEAVIRAFDPCLSCSTHALGRLPLHVQLLAPDGALVDELAVG